MLLRILTLIATLALAACAAPGTPNESRLRIATFNVAMGLERPGELAANLQNGGEMRLHQLAEILQRVRPDVVLLNEFDFDPDVEAADLFNNNYLAIGHNGHAPIRYRYHYRAPVNTGVASGLDLDGDGRIGGPGDAWGYGRFPGQYGMLVLSRYPIRADSIRTFQNFRWSQLPGARRPVQPDGAWFHDDATWEQIRLSSKSHWDLPIEIGSDELHLLAFHPTPPVFDGREDRNGLRNADEIRLWRDYTDPGRPSHLVDDAGTAGGLHAGAPFVIAGDFNADPLDGDSLPGAAAQLLRAPWIDASCVPRSSGGALASSRQGGINLEHRSIAAADTADFNDEYTGNLRLDYLLPSAGLRVVGCGVLWPAPGEDGADLVGVSDHRLVWLDLAL